MTVIRLSTYWRKTATARVIEESKDALKCLIQEYPEAANAINIDGMTPLSLLCTNNFWNSIVFDPDINNEDLSPETRERFRKFKEMQLIDLRQEMIEILARAYPEAIHIADRNGYTPLTITEGAHTPTFEMMKAFGRPQMAELRHLQEELKNAQLDSD